MFKWWRMAVLDVTTIGLHHLTGVPIGTGVIVLCCTSWSNDSLMIFFQCIGIGIGVCQAIGLALGLIWISAGGEFIAGNGDAQLNSILLNLFSK